MSIHQKQPLSLALVSILLIQLLGSLFFTTPQDFASTYNENLSHYSIENTVDEGNLYISSTIQIQYNSPVNDWSWDIHWLDFLNILHWKEILSATDLKIHQVVDRHFGIREIIFPSHYFW